MISCIKKNFFKFILGSLLSIILGLDYFGFCYSQKRFLSDEEKRNLVINYILVTEKNALAEIRRVRAMDDNEYKREREKYLPDEPILYRDIEEFLTLNPNCCQVTTNYKTLGGEGNPISCWERLTGWSAVVGIRYLKRYRDNEGIIQTKFVEIFPSISNCGELIWDLV